jgi:CubicO group peptidase (beta-lactamase class C family)
MKKGIIFKIYSISTFYVIVFVASLYSQAVEFTGALSYQTTPFRLSEPVDSIITDLETYIPIYMRAENIPGVAIALIRDGNVVWTEGFGVVNTITAEPVTYGTLFEVASISKLVTAYIALRFADQGILSLDEPLNSYLPDPWLPPSEYLDVITMRHVLSHSSGLGHLTFSKNSLFAPGRGFYYSNKGFLYLQAVLEQLTGQSLEEVAKEMVFVPLELSSCSYVNHAGMTVRTANGHIHAILPILIFSVLFFIALVIISIIWLLILLIWKRHRKATRRMIFIALTIAYGLVLIPIFVFLGKFGLLEFAWLIAFCGIFLAIAFELAYVIIRVIFQKLFAKWLKYQNILVTLLSVLILVGLILLASTITNLPVPKWPAVPANAASSFRATAGDMATFLIELSNPQYLSGEIAKQLQSPQVWLSSDLSWGLGPGIHHGPFGNALWQWGQHIDFQSVLIVYPQYGFGVVVLTNNDLHNPDVAIEIALRALGGSIDSIRRASHLEFNYSDGS